MTGGTMRNQAFVLSVCLSLSAAACDRAKSLRLPDPAPEAELAFGALYEGEVPTVVGDFVDAKVIYSGRYALSGGAGLTARIFFVRAATLQQRGLELCAQQARATERLLCKETVIACAENPSGCWQGVRTAEGCGPNLDLGEDLPVEAFTTENGRLEPLGLSSAPAISICGPSMAPGCPNRRAGYIVSEDGQFGCVAEVRQLGCQVTLRAADCGLAEVTIGLDASGAPIAPQLPGCEVSPVTASSLFEGGADFSLECGMRNFDFHPQSALLATAECGRSGPGAFETLTPTSGRISDALSIAVRGEQSRLVMNGIGYDQCTLFGCQRPADTSCNSDCKGACSTSFQLGPCSPDGWLDCVPITQETACLDRCRTSCERSADDAHCRALQDGLARLTLTLSTPELPEVSLALQSLDTSTHRGPARGHPTLAQLPGAWFASLTEGLVLIHESPEPNAIAARGQFETQMKAAGLVSYGPDLLAWYGEVDGQLEVRTGQVLRADTAQLTVSANAILVAGLPEANTAVLGGPTGRWLYLANVATSASSQASAQIHIVDLEAGTELPALDLPGSVTALSALPQGGVLAAFQSQAARSSVAVLQASQGRVTLIHTYELVPGLRIRAMTLDPRSCAQGGSGPCQVFVGFEPSIAGAPALLGALSYDPLQPSMLGMTATLRTIGAQSVSHIVVDAQRERVWAVAGDRNQLSPFLLAQ